MSNEDNFEQFFRESNAREFLAGAGSPQEAVQPQAVPSHVTVHQDLMQTVQALIQQNTQILSMLSLQQQAQQPRSSSTIPSGSSDVMNFNVMPDLSKSIDKFDGEEGPSAAKAWLQQLESTASLHHWPDAFAY